MIDVDRDTTGVQRLLKRPLELTPEEMLLSVQVARAHFKMEEVRDEQGNVVDELVVRRDHDEVGEFDRSRWASLRNRPPIRRLIRGIDDADAVEMLLLYASDGSIWSWVNHPARTVGEDERNEVVSMARERLMPFYLQQFDPERNDNPLAALQTPALHFFERILEDHRRQSKHVRVGRNKAQEIARKKGAGEALTAEEATADAVNRAVQVDPENKKDEGDIVPGEDASAVDFFQAARGEQDDREPHEVAVDDYELRQALQGVYVYLRELTEDPATHPRSVVGLRNAMKFYESFRRDPTLKGQARYDDMGLDATTAKAAQKRFEEKARELYSSGEIQELLRSIDADRSTPASSGRRIQRPETRVPEVGLTPEEWAKRHNGYLM